jgi:hypothetical protein
MPKRDVSAEVRENEPKKNLLGAKKKTEIGRGDKPLSEVLLWTTAHAIRVEHSL